MTLRAEHVKYMFCSFFVTNLKRILTYLEKCEAALAAFIPAAKAALVIKNYLDCKEDYILVFSMKVKQTLFSLIDEMEQYRWLFTQIPQKNFSRMKKWSFSEVIKFILTAESGSLRDELLKYFDYKLNTPSNSSFNQRRAQILPEAFEFLFQEFNQSYDMTQLFNGLHIVACDGSDLNISYTPEDATTYFSQGIDQKGYNQLHLNAMYDLCSRRYIDAVIQPGRKKNECQAMTKMIDRFKGDSNTLFMADRGYESYNVFAHVQEKGMFYLIRARDANNNCIIAGLKQLPKTDEYDVIIPLRITRSQTKEIKQNPEIYKYIASSTPLDYIDCENKYYDITLRIVRFKLTSNTYECVITNLPQDKYPPEVLKELYGTRWGIETSFRELKYAVGLAAFHSKKTEYIIQEIWSRLILYNFCEIITTSIVVPKLSSRKHDYQLNYTRAIKICLYFLRIKKEKAPPNVENLIRQELLPVRVGRTDPRKVKPQSAISFLYRVA